MSKTIWVTHTTYEKNADDGIEYFTNRDALADAVFENEQRGGNVQVYECKPVSHEVYSARASIWMAGDPK